MANNQYSREKHISAFLAVDSEHQHAPSGDREEVHVRLATAFRKADAKPYRIGVRAHH